MIGEAQVDVSYGKQASKFMLYIVKDIGSCLLGRNWLKHICLDWKSIASVAMKEGHNSLAKLLKQYELVFKEDLGMLKTAMATLSVKPDATPKFLSYKLCRML